MDLRKRWRSRSVILNRWLVVNRTMRQGEPLCELNVDGTSETMEFRTESPADDPCGIYWIFVREGMEVHPLGDLLEYSSSAKGPPQPRAETIHHTMARARYVRRDRYPRIFLSYRRDDTEAYAGRLHESLGREFGEDDVFMDQFSIPPGGHFEWTIQQAAAHCAAMVVLIGPRWLTLADSFGVPRLHNERDLCHREICAALDRGVPVIPVLVPEAVGPLGEDLPQDLYGLQTLQRQRITIRHWRQDVDDIVAELRHQLGGS